MSEAMVLGDEGEGAKTSTNEDEDVRKGTPLNVRNTPVCLTTALATRKNTYS